MVTEAIILAGGLGTRLRSAVPDLPKAMAPVNGRPFLEYLLRFLENNCIERVVLAVGYRSEAIRKHFGLRWEGLELSYSIEDEPLGTGGALVEAIGQVRGQWAFALNGDTFLGLDYQHMAAALERCPDATLAVALRRVSDTSRYGAALVAGGRVLGFSARGTRSEGLINAGTYLIRREICERYSLTGKFSWEQDFLEPRAAQVRPLAFECDAHFIDIGIPESLEQAQTLVPDWIAQTNVKPSLRSSRN